MTTLDIMAALEATPARGAKRCATAEFVYGIPEDTPGRDELIRLFETEYDPKSPLDTRSGQNMAMVLTQLGFEITQNPIHDHRKHACRCYR
jgi:hypothetical protein